MLTSMPKTTTRKKDGRGGHRPGAGRKPLPEGHTQVVAVRLTGVHIAKVERWEDEHDAGSFSAAVRQIIDAAVP
jgi:hypothetical protein